MLNRFINPKMTPGSIYKLCAHHSLFSAKKNMTTADLVARLGLASISGPVRIVDETYNQKFGAPLDTDLLQQMLKNAEQLRRYSSW